MSDILPSYQARAFDNAADVPMDVVHALRQHEAAANVILPFLLKARAHTGTMPGQQLWIAVYDNAKNVEFVLSCTEGLMGKYPLFIVGCKSSLQLAQEESHGRDIGVALLSLVDSLVARVPAQRMFSVFATASVATKFAQILQARAGIQAMFASPYYDATFTFCTRQTFVENLTIPSPSGSSGDVVINLCRADPVIHLDGLAAMCKGFSETSPPYVLNDEQARREAMIMIAEKQVWVHTIQVDQGPPEIACLVATTRKSEGVTAITKVYTCDKWRGHGCAKRLMHRICHEILCEDPGKRIVLYVGNTQELAPARKVYQALGFQGLGTGAVAVPGVEKWLEIGFEGTTCGYW